ncbi:MAG TPA: AIPR family protein [Hanamia sp.]|nr:AIPR family protein [Hanamia sp.]
MQVSFEQWKKFLSIAYGKFDANEKIFLIHTYLSVFSKMLAYSIVSNDDYIDEDELKSILDGEIFNKYNIRNFIDNDFFHWVKGDRNFRNLKKAFRLIAQEISTFDFNDIDEDVLKGVYQELIDLDTRHALGEYYTPDWLCERIVNEFEFKENSKILDPACGSGSFLRAAVHRMKTLHPEITPEELSNQIYGIDIHPLSVQIAKTTFLLSLGKEIRNLKQPIHINVILSNTLKIPEGVRDLFGSNFKMDIDKDKFLLTTHVLEDLNLFDVAVDVCDELAEQTLHEKKASLETLENSLRRQYKAGGINKQIAESFYKIYEGLKKVKEAGRDSIWKFILQNLYKPYFLSGKFDFIIGNPPWFTYSSIKNEEYQNTLNVLAEKYEIKEEGLDSLISDISKYSNSRAKVSNVDLSSRSPQLNKLKALSDSVVTPSGRKWFFEKSRGEFNTKLRIAGSNKNRIEKEYPKNYRFSKEQLGKYFTAWGEQPYIVKKGGEKVFRYFLEEITGEARGKKTVNINREFYENLISKIILFTELEKIYGQGKRAMGQIRSAVIPYSISLIYIYTDGAKQGKQFDLLKIWKKEKLEDDLVAFFSELMELMNELIKKYSESDDYGEYAKNKKLWDDISSSKEIEKFMSSKIAQEILKKYSVPVKEKNKEEEKEVDFERIQMNIEVVSKGTDFYEELKKKYDSLSKSQERKIDTIFSSLIKLEDLNEDILHFETDLMSDIRKNRPEIFDQINTSYNYLLEGTLKFIILKYNKAIENGIDLLDLFKIIEKKTREQNNMHASIFNKIAINLKNGIAPSVNEVFLASDYFKKESPVKNIKEDISDSTQNINLNVLRQMVEWDSRMKILTRGERAYLADFAYELKPLNQFHKTNAQRHLNSLLKAGFRLT